MKPSEFLKNLPAPARMLYRPMLIISLVLHGVVLILPMPSEQEKPRQKLVKITQLPPTQASPNSSPQSSAKANSPLNLSLNQPTLPQSSSDRQESVSPSASQSKLEQFPEISQQPESNSETVQDSNSEQAPQQPKPNLKTAQDSEKKQTPQQSKPNLKTAQESNPERAPQPPKPNLETPQNSNQRKTPQPSESNPKTAPDSNQQQAPEQPKPNPETPQNSNPTPKSPEPQTGSSDSHSADLAKFMNNLDPSDYLFFALNHLKDVENEMKKSAALDKCSKKDDVFNCKLKTNSPTDELVHKLQQALEKQKFTGFSKVESYKGPGTLYKAQMNDVVPYFLITNNNGISTIALSDKPPS
jgi:hypothetical protein